MILRFKEQLKVNTTVVFSHISTADNTKLLSWHDDIKKLTGPTTFLWTRS